MIFSVNPPRILSLFPNHLAILEHRPYSMTDHTTQGPKHQNVSALMGK